MLNLSVGYLTVAGDCMASQQFTTTPFWSQLGWLVGLLAMGVWMLDHYWLQRSTQASLITLASIVASSEDAIIGKRLDGTIYSWNAAAEKLYGYTAAEIVGQSVSILMPIESRDEMPRILTRISQGERLEHYETVRVRKNGQPIPISLTVSPIKDKRGKIIGASSSARDITERLVVEQMKDEFISLVSHELRTPLTSIRTSLGLLTSGLLKDQPERAQWMLDVAMESTNRLVRLINDILDIERIKSGKVVMQKTPCQPLTLIQQAVNGMQAMADKAAVTLVIEPIQWNRQSSTTPEVLVDGDRVIQTLMNLLSNAIKFSYPGGSVRVTATYQAEQWLFCVQDQGRGVPPHQLETIFEKFQQVDTSDSRQYG